MNSAKLLAGTATRKSGMENILKSILELKNFSTNPVWKYINGRQ